MESTKAKEFGDGAGMKEPWRTPEGMLLLWVT